jgi:hypothetical protein
MRSSKSVQDCERMPCRKNCTRLSLATESCSITGEVICTIGLLLVVDGDVADGTLTSLVRGDVAISSSSACGALGLVPRGAKFFFRTPDFDLPFLRVRDKASMTSNL